MKNLSLIMTSLIVLVFLMEGFTACSDQKKSKDEEKGNHITPDSTNLYLNFDKDEYNFGVIDGNDNKNEFITTDFVCINESEKPIIILKADVSCGCISVKIPDKPIQKGEHGIIKVTLDVRKSKGDFYRQIYIKTNIKDYTWLLRVRGKIER